MILPAKFHVVSSLLTVQKIGLRTNYCFGMTQIQCCISPLTNVTCSTVGENKRISDGTSLIIQAVVIILK